MIHSPVIKKIGAATASSLLVKILQALLGIMVSVLLARGLGLKQFGVFSFFIALLSLFTIPTTRGLIQLVIRETSLSLERNDFSRFSGIQVWGYSVAVIYAVLASLVISLLLFVSTKHTFGNGLSLVSLILMLLFLSLLAIPSGVIAGLKKSSLSLLPEGVILPACFIALLGFGLLMFPDYINAQAALLIRSVAALLAFVFAYFLAKRLKSKFDLKAVGTNIYQRDWLRAALPFTVIGGMQVLNQQTGVLILGFTSSAEEIGIYRVAVQWGMLFTFVMQAMNRSVSPYFATASLEKKKINETLKILELGISLALFVSVCGLFFMLFFADKVIVFFYGKAFVAAAVPLLILLGSKLFGAVHVPIVVLLNMQGREKIVMRIMLLCVAMNIVLTSFLSIKLGAIGAAVSQLIVNLILSVLILGQIKEICNQIPFVRHFKLSKL